MSSAQHSRLEHIKLGTRFAGRYDLQSLLGEGGMGAVYGAHDVALDERVAVKLLVLPKQSSVDSATLFRQEVKLSRRVTHHHVIRVYDIGALDDLLYMTMEWVHGSTLRQVLNRSGGQLEPREVARLGHALAEGLSAVHGHGIVHRDIKPGNVLIEPAGRVILTDFGIAGHVDADSLQGRFVGTVRYMAPEQFRKEPITFKVDLFALGLVLYEALTARLPREHSGVLPGDIIDHALDLKAAGARGDADVLERFEALLRSCLATNPEQRPASAAAVAQVLDELSREAKLVRAMPQPAVENSANEPRIELMRKPAEKRWTTAVSELGTRGVAVLAFRHAGPADLSYLGFTLADELVDLLSQSRGLKVLGTGATSPFADKRDPVAIGKALGVLSVIDGTVQTAGDRSRLILRLFDAQTGAQNWVGQHEGTIADLLAFQPILIRRVAEQLRVDLTTRSYGTGFAADAIDLFLAARRDLNKDTLATVVKAVETLEKCVQLAPGFAPASAAHAMAAVRAWFLDRDQNYRKTWEIDAIQSVDRAMQLAPDLAEAHVAAAMLATQRNELHRSARSVSRALSLAPNCVEALDYLGMLQCEAGQSVPGVAHLTAAIELASTRVLAFINLARFHLIEGRGAQAIKLIEAAEVHAGGPTLATVGFRLRTSTWYRNSTWATLGPAQLEYLHNDGSPLVRLWHRVVHRQVTPEELNQFILGYATRTLSPRTFCVMWQHFAEMRLCLGELDEAMSTIERIVNAGFFDVAWLERCPLLDPLRSRPEFAAAYHMTQQRVKGIWDG